MGRKRDPQGQFDWREWGGKREGAGRKPVGAKAGVPHRKRHDVDARHPVHVTMKLRKGLPDMRSRKAAEVIIDRLRAGRERDAKREKTLRVVHFTILGNHIHMIVEADEKVALSRCVGGLAARIAKGLNKLWGRKGQVWKERFHSQALTCPSMVRNTMVYVFRNAKNHGIVEGEKLDPLSTAPQFLEARGEWRRPRWSPFMDILNLVEQAVCAPLSWFLRIGWHRAGPITGLDVVGD